MRLSKGQNGEGMQATNGQRSNWIHSVVGLVWSLTVRDTTHQEPAKQIYFKIQDTKQVLIQTWKINVSSMNCQTSNLNDGSLNNEGEP